MAKRFTDTNKYKKHFFRGLQGAYKLLWDYLYHDCDHAGIWIVDFEIAQLLIGKDMPINKETALKVFNTDEIRVVELDGGKKWFLPSFIEFQYGRLKNNNNTHSSVVNTLTKYDLLNPDLSIKPLTRGSAGDQDKDKDMDKDMDKDKESNGMKLESWENAKKLLRNDRAYLESLCIQFGCSMEVLNTRLEAFLSRLSNIGEWKDVPALKKHLKNSISKHGLSVDTFFEKEGRKTAVIEAPEQINAQDWENAWNTPTVDENWAGYNGE